MAETVVRGNLVQFELANVTTIDGVPITADPATVVLRLADPTGASTDYTLAAAQVTSPAVGTYRYAWTTRTVADGLLGWWVGTWLTTGVPELANKRTIRLVSEKVPA